MSKLMIRLLILALALVSQVGFSVPPAFPNKPIKIIVPYPAGGTTDLLARVVGQYMSEHIGQSVIVENRPGANGMLGANLVAKSPNDGYVIGIASPGSHAANASLYKDVPYDTVKDFTPITLAVEAPLLMVINPTLNIKSIAELVKAAKASPNTLSYASGGSGSSMHLAVEQFANMADIKMNHIPYNGASNAYVDIISGRVDFIVDVLPNCLPNVKTGKLLAIATAGSKRWSGLPDVPTIAESGYPGYAANSWYGFVGPANLPKDVLTKLNTQIVAALKDPEVAKKLSDAGLEIIASSPESLKIYIKSELNKAAHTIKTSNIKSE